MAKEVRNALTVDSNKICSNEKSRKDECGNGIPLTEGSVCLIKPICHRCR